MVTMFAIDSLAVSTSAAQSLSHKYDIKARHSALNCVRAWAAKGYQPIYVSGRQGSYYNLTMEWSVPKLVSSLPFCFSFPTAAVLRREPSVPTKKQLDFSCGFANLLGQHCP